MYLCGQTKGNQPTSVEELEENHRKQKKDLQARIQSLKKTVTKGDKKKKKEIDAEIEKLEKEFEEKCQLELKNFSGENSQQTKVVLNEPLEDKSNDDSNSKVSKAQKRREKKEKQLTERETLIALQEEENKKGPAAVELNKIKHKLTQKGLRIKEVLSDGNCMYYAIADQLSQRMSISKDWKQLRELICNYMIDNYEQFQPYVTSDDGDLLNEEKYQDYCYKVRDTLVWGGQPELKALADVFSVQIEIVQAEGGEITIGNQLKKDATLIITYHRHMFGSGEHYNSTEPLINDTDN